jgi:hypothetical protein
MKPKIIAYSSSLPHELLVKLFCQILFQNNSASLKKAACEAVFQKKSFTSGAELYQTGPIY